MAHVMNDTQLPHAILEVQARARCLYSRKQVEKALDEMALKINHDLGDTNPIFLCVMIGGLIPAGNLLPRLNFPLEVEYIHASRYGQKIVGGDLGWKVKPHANLANRTILIVDDILDGGLTLGAIKKFCLTQSASKVYTAVLLDKKDARLPDGLPSADYTGLVIGNGFVFGYG